MDKKNIGIITITDGHNYGNKLQNYALQKYCEEALGLNVYTLKNDWYTNNKKNYYFNMAKYFIYSTKCKAKSIVKTITREQNILIKRNRLKNFKKFCRYINFYPKKITAYTNLDNFDYIVVGSDQVWNPHFHRLSEVDLLMNIDPNKRVSYSASFGIDVLPDIYQDAVKEEVSKFKAISTREDKGKEIIKKLTGRDDVEVLIDPTMLLTTDEWDKLIAKPVQLQSNKYILTYFLGKLSENRKKEIERIANENSCEIINLMDKRSKFHECNPSEFLYLEKNAFLVCTDSFHSSVFAFLYNTPFVIFEREDSTKKMNSRIDTLLTKFNIKNRVFDGKITEKNLKNDYSEGYKILEEERKKSNEFLRNALNIKR